ncbi:MAG TPA: MFS transporter [Ardenticatenaceae bacterium]|jgi:hypothetical protein
MAAQTLPAPRGMRTFYTVWLGQLVSLLGSSTTSFAIGIWLFTETGSVTAVALVNVFYLVAAAAASVVAGAVVDRHDRRMVIIVADTVQALASLAIGLLLLLGWFEVWAIYVAVALSSAAQAFQGPAWGASIPMIVPKEQLGRAAGLGRLNQAVGRLAAPALAGALLLTIGIGGVILVDFATFLFAITVLFFVRIPNPPPSADTSAEKRSVLRDIRFGWRYLLSRQGLLTFIIIVSLLNLFLNFATTLTVPMALLIANEATVGVMMSIESSGMLVGTLVMSAWGGPKRRRVWLVLAMIMVQGASLFIIAARPSIVLMTVGGFLMMLCFALIGTNMGPVFQTKVALDVQGRVFATSAFLSVILEPMGQVVVGPLTDRVFEPLMARGGALAPVLGPLIGVGPGRGMAVVFFLMGACIVGLGLYGFLNPRVRLLEEELPDVLPNEAEVEREREEVAGSGMTPAVEFRE